MREQALLLRLVAAELQHEERSVIVLRKILEEIGWDAAQIDAAATTITKAVVALYRQASFLERAT